MFTHRVAPSLAGARRDRIHRPACAQRSRSSTRTCARTNRTVPVKMAMDKADG